MSKLFRVGLLIFLLGLLSFILLSFHSPSRLPATAELDASLRLSFSWRADVQWALRFNQESPVLNAERFPPPGASAIPLLLLVHRKARSLAETLRSLERVEGINTTTLVVSHDGVSEEVWEAVRGVSFMRVKQLVHPYSPWLPSNRDLFPGHDPAFRSTGPDGLPHGHDSHGNPREARLVALKHHWWWALHAVFNATPALFGTPPPPAVAYLEDDWALSRDYYLAARSLTRFALAACPQCVSLNMGAHPTLGRPEEHAWRPADVYYAGIDNLGLVLLRRGWEVIAKGAEQFCSWDDYNWDWTVKAMLRSMRSIKPSLLVRNSRVQHAGRCGLHGAADEDSCRSLSERAAFFDLPFSKQAEQDPHGQVPAGDRWVFQGLRIPPLLTPPFGGWGAEEDHRHCLNVAKGAVP